MVSCDRLDEPDAEKIIKEAWAMQVHGNRPDCMFWDKLKNVKIALKEWSRGKFGKLDEIIDGYKRDAMRWEIEAESRQLDEVERSGWLVARRKWIDKDREKIGMLKQKARIKSDEEGDENSKYFHSIIRRSNNKNNILGLIMNGMWSEDPEVIKGDMFRFYKNIFKEEIRERDRNFDVVVWQKLVRRMQEF